MASAHEGGNMILMQRLVVIVATPGSGKDQLIRAIHDLGARHAQIVPKHTSRERWDNDGSEMICPGDTGCNVDACDIRYKNYGDWYGIDQYGGYLASLPANLVRFDQNNARVMKMFGVCAVAGRARSREATV